MKSDLQKLLDGALKLLSIRPHSRQEITAYLHRKTSDLQLIDQVISKLDKLNLINDRDFSQWLIESRSRSSPRGKRRLLFELKSKGIDPGTIQDSLVLDNEDSLAQTALDKKVLLWKNLSYHDFHTKAGRFLAFRGFSWDTIERVIKNRYNSLRVN